ncbi:hypothetical protein PROFUN_02779 [Planoprotostelium fungivorum]|uniref:Uncharacterized protein n=1 Tax=Planoprotostelium fungivorum TaxID=1890364 RepID=A0A2P6NXJ2_9EUKA|nr:hypothetical protein PROFUN_02779 [Planoprotostelium fungivorum]
MSKGGAKSPLSASRDNTAPQADLAVPPFLKGTAPTMKSFGAEPDIVLTAKSNGDAVGRGRYRYQWFCYLHRGREGNDYGQPQGRSVPTHHNSWRAPEELSVIRISL